MKVAVILWMSERIEVVCRSESSMQMFGSIAQQVGEW